MMIVVILRIININQKETCDGGKKRITIKPFLLSLLTVLRFRDNKKNGYRMQRIPIICMDYVFVLGQAGDYLPSGFFWKLNVSSQCFNL